MTLQTLVTNIKNLFNETSTPANTLPSLLLYATSIQRSGLSAMDITSNIIKEFPSIGIPTGTNTDGTDNLINAYTYLIVKNIIHDIKLNGCTSVTFPPGSIMFKGVGGNAGGPVVVEGTNTNYAVGKGIEQ